MVAVVSQIFIDIVISVFVILIGQSALMRVSL